MTGIEVTAPATRALESYILEMAELLTQLS